MMGIRERFVVRGVLVVPRPKSYVPYEPRTISLTQGSLHHQPLRGPTVCGCCVDQVHAWRQAPHIHKEAAV